MDRIRALKRVATSMATWEKARRTERRLNDGLYDAIVEAKDQGWSQSEIARQIGVNRRWLSRFLQRHRAEMADQAKAAEAVWPAPPAWLEAAAGSEDVPF